ncbi:DUF72 domain-containing protein [Myxococcota bacterium]|nr:DUF72 domain-containing protein [Myxococcota bacterium]
MTPSKKDSAADDQLQLGFGSPQEEGLEVTTKLTMLSTEKLAQALPPTIYMGTTSWAHPEWKGLIYKESRGENTLRNTGLAEYCTHPLMRTILLKQEGGFVDWERDLRRMCAKMPERCRVVIQVPAPFVIPRITHSEKYGMQGRETGRNPDFLSLDFFSQRILKPAIESAGEHLGALLIRFPPLLSSSGLRPLPFAERLGRLLEKLHTQTQIVVELAEAEFFTPHLARVLGHTGATLAFSTALDKMTLEEQVSVIDPNLPGVVLFGPQNTEIKPQSSVRFDRINQPDPAARNQIADIIAARTRHPLYLIVDNEAEGCAPLSITEIARLVAGRLRDRGTRS